MTDKWTEENHQQLLDEIMDKDRSKTPEEQAAMVEINRLIDIMIDAANIISINLYVQREKVGSARMILEHEVYRYRHRQHEKDTIINSNPLFDDSEDDKD